MYYLKKSAYVTGRGSWGFLKYDHKLWAVDDDDP